MLWFSNRRIMLLINRLHCSCMSEESTLQQVPFHWVGVSYTASSLSSTELLLCWFTQDSLIVIVYILRPPLYLVRCHWSYLLTSPSILKVLDFPNTNWVPRGYLVWICAFRWRNCVKRIALRWCFISGQIIVSLLQLWWTSEGHVIVCCCSNNRKQEVDFAVEFFSSRNQCHLRPSLRWKVTMHSSSTVQITEQVLHWN